MQQYALKDIPFDKFLEAAVHLAKSDVEGRYVYNLVMTDPDGVRVKGENYWVAFDNGKLEYGEGRNDDPEATEFTVLQGGLDTIVAMQVFGMKAAMNAMMLGYITASDLKRAEKWFQLLETGEDAVVEALKKVGIELTDTDLDIYEELQLQ